MNLLALVAAASAGAAVLLVVLGVFWRSRPVAVERLERLTGAAPASGSASTAQRPNFAQLLAQSPLLLSANRVVERRAWSEQLGRDLARADLTLRPIEYIVIRVLVIAGCIALFLLLGVDDSAHPGQSVGAARSGGARLPAATRLSARRQQARLASRGDA